jgi:exosome complex RNA-binding protein Rrp42 (RNase PH superfamily)
MVSVSPVGAMGVGAGTGAADVVAYIVQGAADDIRFDGRGATDFRMFRVENNLLPHVNGSGRVRVGTSTDVVCAVKLEIGDPDIGAPDRGRVEVNVEVSNPEDERYKSEITTQLQRCVRVPSLSIRIH